MGKTVLSEMAMILLLLLSACKAGSDRDGNRYLPLFHFSAGSGWTGEPAGILYDEGEYHLFYQYNPSEAIYGHIHWGHVVSKDLVQWQILPVALSPDTSGYPDSGSMIVDEHNTSGLGTHDNAPFIAFYTSRSSDAKQSVAMAYSLDKGVSWIKGDRLLLSEDHDGSLRYPHVSWSDEFDEWIMTVSTGSSISFYTSGDCKHWEYKSDFQYPERNASTWEGSDFFPLQVEGSTAKKWVLLVNMGNGPAEGAPSTRCFIGDFDGTSFRITQTKELWLDYGKDNYAGTTINNLPADKRIWMGWMNCWEYANLLPTSGWRGSMTFPRRLSLVKEGKHYVLSSALVPFLEGYSKKVHSVASAPVTLSGEKKMKYDLPSPGKPFLLRLRFDNRDNRVIWRARNYGVSLRTKSGKKLSIGYQNELSYYYIDRSGLEKEPFSDTFGRLMGASYRSEDSISDWCILVDKSSIELVADKGRIALTALCYPEEAFSSLEVYSEAGTVTLLEASVTELENK